MQNPAKTTREYISRAQASLRRDHVLKSLDAAVGALGLMISNRFFGKEKFETEVLMQELIKHLNNHQEIKDYFHARKVFATPFLRYSPGGEAKILPKIKELQQAFLGHMEAREEAEKADRVAEKERLLTKGQELLDAGQAARGKGYLRRVVEHFGSEAGIITEIGRRMLAAKLYPEAAEILEQGIERFPADSKAYALAIQSYTKLQEYEKAEAVFLRALRQFGAHPRTHLNMSRLYLEWRRYDKAYDFAKMAYDKDSSLTDAQTVMEQAGRRIFKH